MRHTRSCVPLFGLICLAWAWSAPLHAQDALKDAATQLAADLLTGPKVQALKSKTLVVAEFTNINGRGDAVPRIFQEKLTTALIRADHFEVVERAQLEKAMRELRMDAAGLTDADKRKELGKLLGADCIVVGSMSENNGVVSFDARVVVIETGKSIAAADVVVGAGQAAAAGANPPGVQRPAADLNQPAAPQAAGEGTYLGKVENSGLLGGGRFRTAWREKLDAEGAESFAVGDVIGDGQQRLMVLCRGAGRRAAYWTQGRGPGLATFRWEGGRFRRKNLCDAGLGSPLPGSPWRAVVRVFPEQGAPAAVVLSWEDRPMFPGHRGAGVLRWRDGALETLRLLRGWYVTDVRVSSEGVLAFASGYHYIGGNGYTVPACMLFSGGSPGANGTERWLDSMADRRNDAVTWAATGGDLDGDGKTEIAIVEPVGLAQATVTPDQLLTPDGQKKLMALAQAAAAGGGAPIQGAGSPIQVLTLDGQEKWRSENPYGGGLTTWSPQGTKTPYLVARRNEAQAVGEIEKQVKRAGGYVYLLQWDGESYAEIWRSDKLDDGVLDFQVGDPKNEGQPGLIILSSDAKGCYLTKIVAQ